MADNENMVVEEKPKKKFDGAKVRAGIKEWFRKQIVNLKRRPSNIALLFFVITSLIYMIAFSIIAQMLYEGRTNSYIEWSGLCSFVTFLFSILILVLYLQAFPKRKKPNVPMLVLVGVFIAVMFLADIVCYIELQDVFANATTALTDVYYESGTVFIVHMIFLAVSTVLLACTPLFKMLLMKINTRKEVESTVSEMHGQLDLEET